jgi:nitric oxide dioxygenase
MNLGGVEIADDAEIYLCGNSGFVQAVRAQLTGRGIAAGRVHCELFSPNDWLLD